MVSNGRRRQPAADSRPERRPFQDGCVATALRCSNRTDSQGRRAATSSCPPSAAGAVRGNPDPQARKGPHRSLFPANGPHVDDKAAAPDIRMEELTRACGVELLLVRRLGKGARRMLLAASLSRHTEAGQKTRLVARLAAPPAMEPSDQAAREESRGGRTGQRSGRPGRSPPPFRPRRWAWPAARRRPASRRLVHSQ